MTTPKLSLNERLAIEFGSFSIAFDDFSIPYLHNKDGVSCECDDYENNNLAAFALLEKAKQDGKVQEYSISYVKGVYDLIIWKTGEIVPCAEVRDKEKLSDAITQALAQLLTKDK